MISHTADAESLVRDIQDHLTDALEGLGVLEEWSVIDETYGSLADLGSIVQDIRLSLDALDWWVWRRQYELARADTKDQDHE